MRQIYIVITMLCSTLCLIGQEGTSIEVLETEGLLELTGRKNDTMYVINFWATWCKPCVEEIPYFEMIHDHTFPYPIKVILVSLDFEDNLEFKVVPFVKKNNIRSQVVLMGNTKYNSWIDLIDPSWSGAIPATMIRRGDKKLFAEQSFKSFEELKTFINQ